MAHTVTLSVQEQQLCESLKNHNFLWNSDNFNHTLIATEFCNTAQMGHEDCYKCSNKYNGSIISTIDIPCKLMVIGDAGVGKTSFVQRYVSKRYKDVYQWTVGGNI